MHSLAQLTAFYRESAPFTLPYRNERLGIQIDELSVICSQCGSELRQIRGTAVEHASCVDFQIVALCAPCRCITRFHFRAYADGRYIHHSTDGWVAYDPHDLPWWRRIWQRGRGRLRLSR